MRTSPRARWVIIVALAVLAIAPVGRSQADVSIVGGTPQQQAMARWAIGRFDAVGLVLPPIEIRFHPDRSGCRGHSGYHADGVANLCRRLTDLLAARNLLHEMAHGWLDANVTGSERDRFLELRGLATWNDERVEWDARGYEHGAEIIAWALGDQSGGILMPSIPDNALDRLAAAYELMTGDPIPPLAASEKWSTG